jgi:hypothetical protein
MPRCVVCFFLRLCEALHLGKMSHWPGMTCLHLSLPAAPSLLSPRKWYEIWKAEVTPSEMVLPQITKQASQNPRASVSPLVKRSCTRPPVS